MMTSKWHHRFLLTLSLLTVIMTVSARDNRFYVYNAASGLADNSAQTLFCTLTGRLVITTMGQINFFDGQKFTYIDPSTENIYPLKNYRGNYHLYFDKYHHLWLKNTHSVTCVNLTTERFVDSVQEEFEKFGITQTVSDIFVDKNLVVWLLTEQGLYSVASRRFYTTRRDLNLQDVETVDERYLLLFYDDGLVEVTDIDTGKIIFDTRPYDATTAARYSSSSVLFSEGPTIYQIRNGQKDGIMLTFDLDSREWRTILETEYHLNNMAEEDSILYIPSEYGYWTYDRRTGATTHEEVLAMADGSQLLTDINAVAFDRQGGMWIGTEKRGLLYSRPIASPFSVYTWQDGRALELATILDKMIDPRYEYRGRSVNCVFHDSRGWDWVGTSSGLLCYRNANDKLPQVYTRKEGLLNNVIHTICEDEAHNIWVGTSYGICCLLLTDGKLRYINSYNEWDKIPKESFVNGRSHRLADGTIVMQMLDHVIEFNPSKMRTITDNVSFEIYPKLVRLLVNGNDIHTGDELDGNVILERALTRTKEINLNYNQNSVSLTFSALNYFRPQQTYYRVRVKGLDDVWRVFSRYNSGGLVDAQGMLHLPLVALKPGTYIIEIQTSMLPDNWETVPYEWVINVNEPWWRTTGMLALLGLLVFALLMANLYYYYRNTNMRATRNSEEQSVIKRIRAFAERCSQHRVEVLEPIPEEFAGYGVDPQTELSPEFVMTMIKMMPLVLSKDVSRLTMRELSEEAGMDIQKFYRLVMANIYKSPRALARTMMLSKAEELLRTTQKDVQEIADECGFVSANFFIATFYREKRKTPDQYRKSNSIFQSRLNGV